MPATLTGDLLGIECVFSDGSAARFELDGLPCPELARDLLTGLAELIHPHGTVDSAGSAGHYVQSVRHMTRKLAALGFTGGAADLRRPRAAEYWMAAPGPKEACTRRMLLGFHVRRAPGRQAGGAGGRPGLQSSAQPSSAAPLPGGRVGTAYPGLPRDRRRVVRRAQACPGRSGGRHPREHGWSEDNLRWLLARAGPVGIVAFGQHLGCSDNVVRQRGGVLEASRDLFPCLDVVIAYRLLFGIYSGIVPDGIDDLVTGDIDWAGDSAILLSYVKGRTSAESLNLPRRAVRLLEQWLAHSALLRGHAGPEQRGQLWLRLSKPGGTEVSAKAGAASRVAVQRWMARHGVTDADGRPLKIHRSRIRTTFRSLRDKSTWAGRGRATIDPNHSPEVEGDRYLTATTPSQRRAVEAIVEDAQHDLLRRAHPPAVVTDEDAAALARDYPQLISALALDETVIAELAGGQRARVHRGLRRPAVRAARPEGQTLPGTAVGLPALPAGGVRAPARGEPAAAEGVLLPAMAADARCPVHGRVRPLLPADRPGAGPLRPCCPRRGCPRCRRLR